MKSSQGLFIALEGIDGSGTTTQARRLRDWIAQQTTKTVVTTCEPTTGPIGTLIRGYLRREIEDPSGKTLALLFAADRIDHVQREIAPHLKAGHIVISDRYVYSSLAYQSLSVDLEWVSLLNREAPEPDLTIYLQVDAETALRRVDARGQARELFEALELQKQIAARYDSLLAFPAPPSIQRTPRAVAIDAAKDTETVFSAIVETVEPLLASPS